MSSNPKPTQRRKRPAAILHVDQQIANLADDAKAVGAEIGSVEGDVTLNQTEQIGGVNLANATISGGNIVGGDQTNVQGDLVHVDKRKRTKKVKQVAAKKRGVAVGRKNSGVIATARSTDWSTSVTYTKMTTGELPSGLGARLATASRNSDCTTRNAPLMRIAM